VNVVPRVSRPVVVRVVATSRHELSSLAPGGELIAPLCSAVTAAVGVRDARGLFARVPAPYAFRAGWDGVVLDVGSPRPGIGGTRAIESVARFRDVASGCRGPTHLRRRRRTLVRRASWTRTGAGLRRIAARARIGTRSRMADGTADDERIRWTLRGLSVARLGDVARARDLATLRPGHGERARRRAARLAITSLA